MVSGYRDCSHDVHPSRSLSHAVTLGVDWRISGGELDGTRERFRPESLAPIKLDLVPDSEVPIGD